MSRKSCDMRKIKQITSALPLVTINQTADEPLATELFIADNQWYRAHRLTSFYEHHIQPFSLYLEKLLFHHSFCQLSGLLVVRRSRLARQTVKKKFITYNYVSLRAHNEG